MNITSNCHFNQHAKTKNFYGGNNNVKAMLELRYNRSQSTQVFLVLDEKKNRLFIALSVVFHT